MKSVNFNGVAKRVMWASLYSLGLGLTVQSGSCLVLTYHRITDKMRASDPLVVSPENFECQMQFVKKRYLMLSSHDVAEIILRRKPFPNKSCLITFDDGWRDNYTQAFPILRALGIPAIIFLTTDYIGTDKRFWHDVLVDLLMVLTPEKIKTSYRSVFDLESALIRIASVSPESRIDKIHHLIEKFKKLDLNTIISYVSVIREMVDPKPVSQDPAMLTWEEVLEMGSAGISFGSHTKSHVILTQVDRVIVREELRESKSILEARLQKEIQFVAYPNGNFNEVVLSEAQEAGYVGGFTCNPGINGSYRKPFELRRRHILNDSSLGFGGQFSPWLFAGELSGIRHKIKNYLRIEKRSEN